MSALATVIGTLAHSSSAEHGVGLHKVLSGGTFERTKAPSAPRAPDELRDIMKPPQPPKTDYRLRERSPERIANDTRIPHIRPGNEGERPAIASSPMPTVTG